MGIFLAHDTVGHIDSGLASGYRARQYFATAGHGYWCSVDCDGVFIIVGVVGMVALIANGSSLRIGPRLRSFSAIVRSVLWISFALSMTYSFHRTGIPLSDGIFFGHLSPGQKYIFHTGQPLMLDQSSNI